MIIHENGTTLSHEEKSSLESRGKRHEAMVKEFFMAHPNEGFTCEEVHILVPTNNLIGSTKRLLTDLKTEGFLVKDRENKKMGQHGIRIVTYKHIPATQGEINYGC